MNPSTFSYLLACYAVAFFASAYIFASGVAFYLVSLGAIVIGALFFALYVVQWLLSRDDGTEAMRRVSDPISEGAEAFLRVQYGTISKIATGTATLLFFVFLFRDPPHSKTGGTTDPSVTLSPLASATTTALCFVVGAALSGLAGYVGMWVAVRANLRVAAAAAKHDYKGCVAVSVRGGLVTGLLVVGLCVLGLLTVFLGFTVLLGSAPAAIIRIPHIIVGYGFGASLVALFAQLGGGIYTKAADVGADMVGKVEQSIPEDDPRNPAVIADLVGDNVGDCAGRGADLFESIGGEIIGAMILGSELSRDCGLGNPISFIFFPLAVHAFDLVISSVAAYMCNPRPASYSARSTSVSNLAADLNEAGEAVVDPCSEWEDVLDTLMRSFVGSVCLAIGVLGFLCYTWLSTPKAPDAWWHFFGCGIIGCCTAYVFVLVTKYYTDYRYGPVQRIAHASKFGHGTNVISGIGVGLESCAIPAGMIVLSMIAAFWTGQTAGLVDANGKPQGGLFGTAVATMGMLSTAVYVLAIDTFGPITDNAGGIVEMANLPASVRAITDRLDAVGNVTKATTKGYSIGAAGLASFLLFQAYLNVVNENSRIPVTVIDIAIPEVWLGGLLGVVLVFLFSAWSIAAVSKSAQEVVNEVRLQFAQRPGILTGADTPDYDKCVAIVTQSALREMIKPGLLAVLMPTTVGIFFRILGSYTNRPTLGAQAVASMMLFATASGILMALFLNNAGGAWDNAKKYIETGAHGGKGSDAHKAAVTGDTVGDPFKVCGTTRFFFCSGLCTPPFPPVSIVIFTFQDTAGPSIHVLIKLLATMALVTCPLFTPPALP